MTYFYLSALGLSLVAISFVCLPILLRGLRNKKTDNSQSAKSELSNANVIKQRITELEQEVDEGLIDANEKESAIRDLKVALVDETPTETVRQSSINLLTIVVLTLPALIIGAWVYYESNQLSGLQDYAESALEVDELRKKLEEQGPESLTPNDFAKFALSIRNSLRENPKDVKGWTYLGMVNTAIGRLDEGIAAYQKALDIEPQNDSLRFRYAESLMISGTEANLYNAKRQLEYLISKQPQDKNNRLMLTSVAIQLQDVPLAVSQFTLIKDAMNASSQFYQSIVAELKNLGVTDINIVGAPDLANNNVQRGTSNINSFVQTQLDVTVNISDQLQTKLPNDAYLIVFAQRNDGTSKAPLAVKRFVLGALPVKVTLSDSDAMIPSMKLSSVDKVIVTARISFDENVMPAKGELEGSIKGIDLAINNVLQVEVIIDTVL